MKDVASCITFFAATLFSLAESTNSLEKFSPKFSTNTQILWKAPTNDLPNHFWTYRRLPPRQFSTPLIATAAAVASLQQEPKPSTNAFFIWSEPNPCGVSHSIFSIQPASSTISFYLPHEKYLAGDVPDNKTVLQRAFEYAARFGLDGTQLVPKDVYVITNSPGGCGDTSTNSYCARGVLLSRKLDGVSFFGNGNDETEGFSIELGGGGQIRSFSFMWPSLEADSKCDIASPDEMIRCIRVRRVLVVPESEETNYIGRIMNLSKAKTFTITKITPYYSEGVFGESPTNSEPPKVVLPFAELEAVSDIETNRKIRLLTPILSSEVNRLLKSTVK